MRWAWDPSKDKANRRTHGLGIETAQQAFLDPLAMSRQDPISDEERWQTVGRIGPVTVFVVHTFPQPDETNEEVGRIISARKATPGERRAYEEGRF